MKLPCALAVIILLPIALNAQEIAPEAASKAREVFHDAIDSQTVAGGAHLVVLDGKTIYFEVGGKRDIDDGLPFEKDTILRFYSMSKPITSVAAMSLYEKGQFKLDDPISKFIPEFEQTTVLIENDDGVETVGARRQITVRDVFRHTTGYSYGDGNPSARRYYEMAGMRYRNPAGMYPPKMRIDQAAIALAGIPAQHHPGERFTYGFSTDLLGRLIEVWSGRTLDEYLQEAVFTPLEMYDTGFSVPADKRDRFASCHTLRDGKPAVIDKGSESEFIDGFEFLSGGGGLVSTIMDYANFCQMLVDEGVFRGRRILRPETVRLMFTDQLNGVAGNFQFGLGFAISDVTIAIGGDKRSVKQYSWGGYASTDFRIIPEERLFQIIVRQKVPTDQGLAGRLFPIIYRGIRRPPTRQGNEVRQPAGEQPPIPEDPPVEPSRELTVKSDTKVIDWDQIYEERLKSSPDIRRKVQQGQATKVEVIEWLKLVGNKDAKGGRNGNRHNFPETAFEYAKLIEPQLGVPPRVDLNEAVEIPLFVNGKRAYGNLGTACDNRTYLGKATVSGSILQRYPGRTADGKLLPDVIWISFGRNSTEEFEEVVGSVQMIGYNRKTGATAFFESNGSNLRPWVSLDKETWRMRGVMPWIDDPNEFNRAFITPGSVQCVECHQADPFITNDFINAAKIHGTDETVVPALDKDAPYYVIGGENWDMRTIHIEGNACFHCHRVGMSTMNLFMENDWDPNQHMPPHDPGSLREDFEQLLAAWKNGPENTPGCEWIIPPAGSTPGRVVGGDYPHKAGFNQPDLKAIGRRNPKPRMIADPEWTQSYKAGYRDNQGRYAGGSEILHLEGHKEKLYAANSYWMEPSNIWYGGQDPKTPWSQILRLDSPNGKWEVDLELGPNNLRAENLKSVTFGTDGAGNSLERPVTLLIATAYSPNTNGADINVFVRDDDAGAWEKTALISGTGESGESNSTRCMTVYRDRVTGVDRLFLPVGLLGIFTGVYDADLPGRIRWNKTPENGRLEKRSLAIVEANDSLVYSSGTKIYRRNDGPSPTHSMIFDASQLSKGPVASPVGGVRGLSVLPNPEGQSESLLFVWAPDSKSRSCVVRLDQDDSGKYVHTEEECVADLMSEYLFGNPVYYALAGYNNILPVLNPATKEHAFLMGFECWIGGRQFPCWQGNERGGFYAGAMYAIRDNNARYWLNEVNGPTTFEKTPLQSVRTYEVSPFESEKGKVIYFGGFVADHGPSPDTAWVYKTSIENALRKDAPRPVRLTPEQSQSQLAALRQPYLFEYREKPAFTIRIPGAFARGTATGGNVFHAKKAFNTLSISVSQSEDPEQAARRYVEALKRAGNGTAEMLRQSQTKLPNGTPAVEFVATWVTKQNAKQTTQALTACKDGHAVTVATHTWEVGPPDKRFFFTLDFE